MKSDAVWQMMVDSLTDNISHDHNDTNYGVAYAERFLLEQATVTDIHQYEKRQDDRSGSA